MKVIKRNGKKEDVNFDRITERIRSLLKRDPKHTKIIDPVMISQKVIVSFKDNMTTTELDNMAADICIQLSITHPDFGILASKLMNSNHQKNTDASFKEVMGTLYNNEIYNKKTKGFEPNPLISQEFYELSKKHGNTLDSYIKHDRDYLIDYFGFKTLYKGYLTKINNRPVERIQHMWMRVALCIHGNNLDKVFETYDLLSTGFFTHATPTLYHAGVKYQQCSSCYLVGTEDSIEGIYATITKCAQISKWAGGVGVHISNIRGRNSYIRKTNGYSDGILPMMQVYNRTARYVNQSQRRNGSFAIYLEPYHPDILEFLDAKKQRGDENERARDLFYALWVPDLFMRYVEGNKTWYLLNPSDYPGLSDVYGTEFDELYLKYAEDLKEEIKEDKSLKKFAINARDLWKKIIESQIETGTPYICYKDAANLKSNQKNIGTIKSSNLCVSGATFVLTHKGYFQIKDLEGENIEVWNGDTFSEVKIHKTGENQSMVKVCLSNGAEIVCTPYHKFYTKNGVKDASQLLRCEQLESFPFPVLEGNGEIKLSYLQGLFAARGKFKDVMKSVDIINHINKEMEPMMLDRDDSLIPYITVNSDEKEVLNSIDNYVYKYVKDTRTKFFFEPDKLKFIVPPYNHNLDTRLRWLEGYIDGIFYTSSSYIPTKIKLSITSANKVFINDFYMLLNTLGIHTSFKRVRTSIYEIQLSNKELLELKTLGFSPKNFNIKSVHQISSGEQCIKVSNVVSLEEKMDTFCFTEPLKYKGVFNGILTGNCSEIIEYSDDKETAVCNLASIALPKFLDPPDTGDLKNLEIYTIKKCDWCKMTKCLLKEFNIKHVEHCLKTTEEIDNFKSKWNVTTFPQIVTDKKLLGNFTSLKERLSYHFNFTKLYEIAKVVTENLNRIIDINYYPIESAEISNLRHRPIGIGVQGLADTFAILKIPFGSEESRKLNKEIFETIYYGALEKSMELAVEQGTYSSYGGSPMSQGKFQFDLWKEFNEESKDFSLTGLWDFDSLREKILKNGVRNSLLVALMPTASTSQILGNTECFEPFNSNYYLRKTLAGEFPVINKHLLKDLMNCNLWNPNIKEKIIYYRGSIQNIKEIPSYLREIYKTVWEIKQKVIIDMAADRAPYICQSQSLNIHFSDPTYNMINSMHFYGWKKGLKTGMYYLRTKPASNSQQFSIDPEKVKQIVEQECESCSA